MKNHDWLRKRCVIRSTKPSWRSAWIVAAILCLAPYASAQQLDQFITDKFDWKMTADEFEEAYGEDEGFEWVSAAKNASRHSGKKWDLETVDDAKDEDGKTTTKRKMVTVRPKIGKMEVGETIARFKEGNLARVEISLFNRGDDNALEKPDFEKKIEDFKALITRLSGARAEERNNKRGAVKTEGFLWKGKTTQYLLEFSSTRVERYGQREFQAEFINLKVAPPAKDQGLLAAVAKRDARKTKSRDSLVENVVKDKDSGDVVIEGVPMVDQGSKGYCAVASAERVLRYYGLEVDQHQMAQMSESTAGGGTSPDKMTEALKSVAGRLKVHMRTHEGIEDYKDFEKMVKNYNRVAKRNDKAVIRMDANYYLSYVGCYQRFDADSLRESRMRGFDRFFKTVQEKVDEGIPILWSLFLGVYPEENIPQPSGGHMRLIIGYNVENKEIIFSDSWGAGHEKKRMKAENAYAMTTGVRTLTPFR